jgi:DNA-binding MarR family transcriptional regulator
MREQRVAELSVPQFRALGFVRRHPETSVSAVAEHLGLSVPAASRLLDILVSRQLLERQISAADRRFVTLQLSSRGTTVLESARHHAAEQLSLALGEVADGDRATILSALASLRRTFGDASPVAEAVPGVVSAEELHMPAHTQGSEGML